VFGTVVEKFCIFLIDTSGSMDPHMDELKKELIHLVWEQLHKHNVRSAYSSIYTRLHLFVCWLVCLSSGLTIITVIMMIIICTFLACRML